MTYRVVTMEGCFEAKSRTELVLMMRSLGYKWSPSVSVSPNAFLNGQPIFTGDKHGGMCGPFWDGGVVRYEDYETYKQLST